MKVRRYAKLSKNQVQKIKRAQRDRTHTHQELATEYHVSISTINKIATGENWGWVNAEGTEVDD